MARKLPVPEIPLVPPRRRGHPEARPHLPSGRTVSPKRDQQPELPDLLEAFWGDRAATGETAETSRVHGGPVAAKPKVRFRRLPVTRAER